MAVTATEQALSRSGDGKQLELTYWVRGTADDAAARDAALAEAPATHDGLTRDTDRPYARPKFVDEGDPANSLWEVRVKYLRSDRVRRDTSDSVYSFDTTGGSEHITQSLDTTGTYVASGNAPDYEGAIGVSGDAVAGVDIVVPAFEFVIKEFPSDAQVDEAYQKALFELTGKVNAATFRGNARGTTLYKGARGAPRGDDDWEIAHHFAGRSNRTGITIGSITGIAKEGWEYLWVRYEDGESEGDLVKRPAAVYVEQVYRYGDFSVLGISS